VKLNWKHCFIFYSCNHLSIFAANFTRAPILNTNYTNDSISLIDDANILDYFRYEPSHDSVDFSTFNTL
jgi:hypothetical protein